jgi:hypothetical protein
VFTLRKATIVTNAEKILEKKHYSTVNAKDTKEI